MVYHFAMQTQINTQPKILRHAVMDDLQALTDIYNHYIINTAITFDLTPFTAITRRPWLEQFAPASLWQCLVLEMDGRIIGYACSARLRPKAAYDTSVECSIYLDPTEVAKGYGRLLYQQLFDNLAQQDIHRCYGVITLPNAPSIALHRSFGFTDTARLTEVGRKFGKYWDTLWMEKPL
jgi:phosphinothricin acetyltransferase